VTLSGAEATSASTASSPSCSPPSSIADDADDPSYIASDEELQHASSEESTPPSDNEDPISEVSGEEELDCHGPTAPLGWKLVPTVLEDTKLSVRADDQLLLWSQDANWMPARVTGHWPCGTESNGDMDHDEAVKSEFTHYVIRADDRDKNEIEINLLSSQYWRGEESFGTWVLLEKKPSPGNRKRRIGSVGK